MSDSGNVAVRLPYLKRSEIWHHEKPYVADFAVDHIDGAQESNHTFDHQDLVITDAQPHREGFRLEQNGFCFLKQALSITPHQADDQKHVKEVYFPEIERLLQKALPGYERIEYIDHLVRRRDLAFPMKPGEMTTTAQPAALPHSDFSQRGCFLAMEQFFPGQQKFYQERDFDLLNVWRVLRGPNNDWPLAVCDYESLNMDVETIECDVLHEHCVGENLLLFKNPQHQWYYLNQQDSSDLIVFRNASSKGDRPVAFHAAFDTGGRSNDPRHSIELRIVAFRPGGEPYRTD